MFNLSQYKFGKILAIAVMFFVCLASEVRIIRADADVKYISEKDARKNNLVNNGGFEKVDPSTKIPCDWHTNKKWAPGGEKEVFVVDSSTAASGQNSWRVKGVERIQYASSKLVFVEPKQEYSFICAVKQMSVGKGELGGYIEISWRTTDGKKQNERVLYLKNSFDWQNFTVHFKSPENAQRVSIYLITNNTDGVLWFDDIVLAEGIVRKADKQLLSDVKYISEGDARKNNLVNNGGFEKVDPSTKIPCDWHTNKKWAPGGEKEVFVVDSSTAASGQNSWRVKGVERIQYASSKLVPANPGQEYTFTCAVKQVGVGEGMLGGYIEISWKTTDGKKQNERVLYLKSSFDWQNFTVGFKSPENAQRVSIYLITNNTDGVLWFDDIVLAEGIVRKADEQLSLEDVLRQYAFYEDMRLDFKRFMEFRSRHVSTGLNNKVKQLQGEIVAMQDKYAEKILAKGLKKNELSRRVEETLGVSQKDSDGNYKPLIDKFYQKCLQIKGNIKTCKNEVDGYIKNHTAQKAASKIKKFFGEKAEYGLGVATSMRKVLKYEPYLGKIAHEAFISLAKNEHEGLQVIVLPLEKSLKQVEVHVSDLSNKKGKILSSDHVKVYPVGYVKTNKPEYPVDYIGWWPDPLLGKSAVDVKVGTNQPFWIDIYVPFDATAGIYKGEITVKPDNSQELKIPLSVTVWDFEIPLKGEFKVFGRFRPDKLLEYYKWESIPEDIELAWYLFQVEHRYSPMDMFSKKITPTPDRGILEKCLKAGLNSVNVMEVSRWLPKGKGTHSWTDPSQDCLDNIREALEKGQALLKKHNALDTGLVFGFDEVSDIRLCPLINKTFGFVKSVTPEFKTATTAASLPIKNIAANVDIWIPRLGLTKREFKAKRDKRPDAEIYYYLFGEPKHPFPNPILIDTPALNGRISFWMMYNRNVRGFLNWFINGWATNYRPAGDKRWPDIPWKPYYGERYSRRNGEGYFIYPGPDGLPLSSIRFENIRDGIEDWEMMNILNKLIQEIAKNDPLRSRGEKALAAVREIVPTNYSYTNNPDELLKRREKIARAIECIKSTVDK